MSVITEQLNIQEIKDEHEDYSVKIVIVGDSGVGKSNILSRFVQNEFSNDCRATVGVELSTKSYKINDKVIKLHLWDTAGQERFKSITSAYYKGAKGAVIVYDITNSESFSHIDKWLREIRELGGKGISVIICGNKSDLEDSRQVSKDEGIEKSQSNGLIFLETSALNSSNIEEAFQRLLIEIYNSTIKQAISKQEEDFTQGDTLKIDVKKEDEKKKKGCC
jgi:Ras-related protein Rab-11A